MRTGLPDTGRVYRGVRAGDLSGDILTHRAFLLRQGEFGLSVSTIQRNALTSLRSLKGTARLEVGAIRACVDAVGIPFGLNVEPRPHDSDPGYAWITGLPAYGEPGTAARVLANDIADALLSIAVYLAAD